MRRLEKSIGGFGSLKVEARIGDSAFTTSVFPSKEIGWLLPVKAAVRKAEGIAEGDAVTIDVRGSALAGRVVPLPFVAKH